MKKWKKVFAQIPRELRAKYGYTVHMRERPAGMPRVEWMAVWVDQHAVDWPIANRLIQGLPRLTVVPKPSARVRYRNNKPILRAAADAAFLQSYEWRQLRMRVLTKRGARCECCGASPKDGVTVINVDHIKPRRDFPELALVESNLQVLCAVCNHGKGNWDQTDWREPSKPTALPAAAPWIECGQKSWQPPPLAPLDPSDFRNAGRTAKPVTLPADWYAPMWWKPDKGN